MTDENNTEDVGTLAKGEVHPAANSAYTYIKDYIGNPINLVAFECALVISASKRNRVAEICLGTLNRLINSEPVSDRYLLGLAWIIRDHNESKDNL